MSLDRTLTSLELLAACRSARRDVVCGTANARRPSPHFCAMVSGWRRGAERLGMRIRDSPLHRGATLAVRRTSGTRGTRIARLPARDSGTARGTTGWIGHPSAGSWPADGFDVEGNGLSGEWGPVRRSPHNRCVGRDEVTHGAAYRPVVPRPPRPRRQARLRVLRVLQYRRTARLAMDPGPTPARNRWSSRRLTR